MNRREVPEQSHSVALARGVAAVAACLLVLVPAHAASAAQSASESFTSVAAAPLLSGAALEGEAPAVTLDSPPLRSPNTTPAFTGTASGTSPVTVELFDGASPQGEALLVLHATGTGASWASAHASPALEGGTYTAIARQSDAQGDTAVSAPVTFAVDPDAPAVALTAPPPRSNDTAPSFSGTASDATPVTVEIFEGPRPEGNLLATAEASGTRGAWLSGPPLPALQSGRHTFTAVALQPSEAGGAPGESAPVTFVVDTEAPQVVLDPPPARSNERAPSFSGTTSEAGEVAIEIYAGSAVQGSPLQTQSAVAAGEGWSSAPLEQPLADGTYTAIARERSAIGNRAGASDPVTFTVDTSPPRVTLNAPLSPTANRKPSFSGTASDHTPVTIEIHGGISEEGPLVGSVIAEAGAGTWVSGRAQELPVWGQYTAVAIQPSSIHNANGRSAPVTFSVQAIAPAVVTEGAAEVSRSSVALYGSVAPMGAGVSECRFEFGTTAAYGKSVDCGFVSGASGFAPAETAAVPVFVRIYGLTPGTAYHYRVVAVGEGGRADGADAAFTTSPPWLFGEEGAAPRPPSATASAAQASAARIAAQIASRLVPKGRGARLKTLLARGALVLPFSAPVAGLASIAWYYTPSRAHGAGTVRVAAGSAYLSAPGSARIVIRLKAAGRRALGGGRRVRLRARCAFTPVGSAPVRVSRSFWLAA